MRAKMLFFAANPVGTRRLALDEELRGIKELCRANDIELVDIPAARPDDWLSTLNTQRFRVLHFSGHGTKGGALQHVGSDGTAQPVSFEALKETLRLLKGDICLVVLNACYSRKQAELIAEDVDCVIAMNNTIQDDAAIAFINAFYRALFSKRSVQDAFKQGRAALMLGSFEGIQVPELLVRSGVDASTVTLVAPSRRNKAFIAFSPADRRFLDELHEYLEYYEQKGILDYWDSTKLIPGARWQQEMRQSLRSSRVGIILVSASLFASKDIIEYQVSPLLQAAARDEIKILCVLLRPYSLTGTGLEQFTLVNSLVNPQPLSRLKNRWEREEIWDKLTMLVRDTLQADT